jgi:hypothetical protein
VEGFSVSGVIRMGSAGVAGAAVSLGTHKVTAAEDGSYTIPSIKPGQYTVTVTAGELQFLVCPAT